MKNSVYIVQIVFCLLIFSCTTDIKKINTEALNLEILSSYENDSVFVTYPKEIKIKDSLLFMLSSSSGHFINVYSYPKLEFLTYIGVVGKSSEELLSIGTFDVDDDYIYLIDVSSKKLLKYSLKNIMQKDNKPAEKVMLNDINIPSLSYSKTEYGFISISATGDRYLLIDEKGEKIKSFGSLPVNSSKDIPKIDSLYIPSLWNVSVDYDKKSNIIAVATKLGDVIEVCNLKTSECNVIIGKGGMPNIISKGNKISIGKIDGYYDIKIANNQIYALYSGVDREKLSEQWRKGINTPDGGVNMKVYSLDGELNKHYILDRYITGFDIDIKNKKIIAIDPNNGVFCSFNLN